MPKLKTKSSAKKRFRYTAGGKIRMKHSGMRHNLRKRSLSMRRKARQPGMLSAADVKIIAPMLPYARKG